MKSQKHLALKLALCLCLLSPLAHAQRGGPGDRPDRGGQRGGFGRSRQKLALVEKFDKDKDGILNKEERKAARAHLKESRANNPGRRGGPRRFPGGRGGNTEPPKPGKKLKPGDVKWYPDATLYAPNVLRTIFIDFEDDEWEKELADFKNTDVEVPATLTVDGKKYKEVGIKFRGNTSFMTVPEGRKRPLNVSMNLVHKKQRLGGQRTLNLLNGHTDPSFLRNVLYSKITRAYYPSLAANHVRVVINGENWGIYINSQQFNSDFTQEWFGTRKGARWKTPGSPRGRANLSYLGDDPKDYKGTYVIKTEDKPEAWNALINLCKVLDETPSDQLVEKLSPILDIDSTLKFLAIDNIAINGDGFWTRTSDYNLYLDDKGKFHILPHDTNETFNTPGRMGGRGGRGGPPGFGGFGSGLGRGQTSEAIVNQGDKNDDGKINKEEFVGLAKVWMAKISPNKSNKVTRKEFNENIYKVFTPKGERRRTSPTDYVREGIFRGGDQNKDGVLTSEELQATFKKWFEGFVENPKDSLAADQLAQGLRSVIPQTFGPPPGGRGGRGPGAPGGGGAPTEIKLDLNPLAAANDPSKFLANKLLQVPSLKKRYLEIVKDVAENWLDWEKKLGPVATAYHKLIAKDVEEDTRKLESLEGFKKGLLESTAGGRRPKVGIKEFADKRRAYLLKKVEEELKKL